MAASRPPRSPDALQETRRSASAERAGISGSARAEPAGISGSASAEREVTRRRLGRVPTWIPLGVVATAAVWLCSSLQNSVEAAGFSRVDVCRTRLDAPPGFRDPRWQEFLALHIAGLPPVDTRDHAAVRGVAIEVARLPFVQAVLEPRVVWPDGIEIPILLRKPAACVRAGTEFLAISEDGILLPGRWPKPPLVEGKFLPVLGPNDGRFDGVRPGVALRAPVDVDGLAVALSLREFLDATDFEMTGPPLIDATHARQTSVEEPGVRIQFEGRRVVYFGRAPGANAPGELPPAQKWEHVRRAIALLRPDQGARDWSLLDVRWDAADIAWRVAVDPDEPADASRPPSATKSAGNPADSPMRPASRKP